MLYDSYMKHIITEYTSKNGIYFHHTISTYKSGDGDYVPPETHAMYEVFLLLSGSVKYRIEGQWYNLNSMDALIISPNKLHSIEIDTSRPYERMVLQFEPNLLPSFADFELFSRCNSPLSPTFIIPKKSVKQFNLVSMMRRCKHLCFSDNKYIDLRFVSNILQIIETLNEIVLSLNESNEILPVKVDKISHACIQYINQNLTNKDKLSPQCLADELHISASHLQHTFKKELGITLHAYIFNQKMQLAKQLLMQGYTPQAVSDMLDYEYYSTFYHNFVKRFNAPPNSFADVQQSLLKNVDI